MTISSGSQVNHLNKMNKAAKDVSLGTNFRQAQLDIAALQVGSVITGGSVLVSSTQSNGSAVVINTGLGTSNGQVLNFYRSGSLLTHTSASQVKVVNTGGSITITGMVAGIISTGDIVTWIAVE